MGGEATESGRRSQGAHPSAALAAALASSLRAEIEAARWFQGKGRELLDLRLVDHVVIPGSDGAGLAIVTATYAAGPEESYMLGIRADETGAVASAAPSDRLWPALAGLATEGGSIAGDHGTVVGLPEAEPGVSLRVGTWRQLDADQSNTSVVLDERVVLKVYRRLWPGPHPEQELLQELTRVRSTRARALIGALRYRRDGVATVLASAYAYAEGTPVGWEPAITELAEALDGPAAELERLAGRAAELGQCLGELHRDLLRAFGGERASADDARRAREEAEAGLEAALAAVQSTAPELIALAPAARGAMAGLERLEGTLVQRVHGDLHVGQLVRGEAGVVAIDFEGDPTVPPDLRRRRGSPLQDVAGLLLSLDHIAAAAARRRESEAATAQALTWSSLAREAALAAYEAAAPAEVPRDPALLRALEMTREWREAAYAAHVLPEWLYAPRLVLNELLA